MFKKPQPKLLNVNKVPTQPKKRRKVTLVFDEEKRREFLGGFRKRKQERKKKAQEQLQQQLKEERKKIKQDARERYKKLVSHRDIPELTELLSKQEHDLEGHTVSILELNVADLTESSKWIGQNKVLRDPEEQNDNDNEHSTDSSDDEQIVGMSLEDKKTNIVQQKSELKNEEMKSKSSKELKRELKKAALKQVKKSKVFKQKQRIEQQKNKKKNRIRIQKAQKLGQKRGKRIKKK